jgi:hypothetical protein
MENKKDIFLDLGDLDIYFFDYIIESPLGQIYTFANPLELMPFLKSYNETNNGHIFLIQKYKHMNKMKNKVNLNKKLIFN